MYTHSWLSSLHACTLSHFSHIQLCDPVDWSPSGSSVHGISQARMLEWIAMPSSRDQTHRRIRNLIMIGNNHVLRSFNRVYWVPIICQSPSPKPWEKAVTETGQIPALWLQCPVWVRVPQEATQPMADDTADLQEVKLNKWWPSLR